MRLLLKLGLLGLAAAVFLFGWVFMVLPRRIIARYDEFLKRHPEGTPVEALVHDPFVDEAGMAMLDRDEVPVAQLRARLGQHGKVDLVWTHTPPFGRVTLIVEYADGKIVKLVPGSLD